MSNGNMQSPEICDALKDINKMRELEIYAIQDSAYTSNYEYCDWKIR